jgi:hypothetical protein
VKPVIMAVGSGKLCRSVAMDSAGVFAYTCTDGGSIDVKGVVVGAES